MLKTTAVTITERTGQIQASRYTNSTAEAMAI